MTVAPTNTYSPNIDRIIKRAMVLTGLVNSNADITSVNYQAQAQTCREYLQDIVDEIATRGVILRQLRLTEVALSAGVQNYTLDVEVLDVVGDAMRTNTGVSNTESLIKQVNIDRWQQLSAKDSQGTPTQMFVYRTASPIELRLWPVPDRAFTLTIQAHVRAPDSVYGTYEVPLEPYWRSYLQYEVAHRFALGEGHDNKAAYLHNLAEQRFADAKNKAQGRPAQQFWVGNNTGWSR